MSGIDRSTSATSTCAPSRTQPIASSGEPVARTVIPHWRSWAIRIRRFVALSSTISATLPCSPLEGRGAGTVTESAGASGATILTTKRLPSPGTPLLSTVIVPPCNSASRLLIASPRPVPPNRREIEASAWLNDWNSRPIRSGGIPIPVSRTATSISQCRLSSRPGDRRVSHGPPGDRHDDLARLGELDRIRQEVEDDLAQPAGIADERMRQLRIERVGEIEALAAEAWAPRRRSRPRCTARARTARLRARSGRPRSSRSRGCR